MFSSKHLIPEGKRNLLWVKKHHNFSLFKTLLFNFKALPIKDAFKIPFIVGRNVKLVSIGKITINAPISTAMFSIGIHYIEQWQYDKETYTIWSNEGVVSFDNTVRLYSGVKICVGESGILTFGGYNIVGSNTKIICWKNITIAKNVGISWECQLFDTNFHNLKDLVANKINKRDGIIEIKEDTFIGNNVSIMKGTKISEGSVVSSGSRVTGNFTKEGKNLLISGNPAVVIDKGYKMLIKEYRDYE